MNRGKNLLGAGSPAGKPAGCTQSSPPRRALILREGFPQAQKSWVGKADNL